MRVSGIVDGRFQSFKTVLFLSSSKPLTYLPRIFAFIFYKDVKIGWTVEILVVEIQLLSEGWRKTHLCCELQAQLQAQTVERKGVGPSTLAASKKRAVEDYAPLNKGQEAHWEVVERMLFLYAKLNPGQGYVQGMNEIIGPIYYVLASDTRQEWQGEW